MDDAATGSTVLERRLRAEWSLLQRLAGINPDRIKELRAADRTFFLALRQTPGLLVGGNERKLRAFGLRVVSEHRVRIEFPEYFPAVPLELYLEQPAVHPNIHPETGFVCLWDRHRVGHTIEHAIHKTVAILGWRLRNLDAVHVMQPDVLREDEAAIRARLAAPALLGVLHAADEISPSSGTRRARLT